MIAIGQAGNINAYQYAAQQKRATDEANSAARASQANEKQIISNGIATKGWSIQTVDGVQKVVDNTGSLVNLSQASLAGGYLSQTTGQLQYVGSGGSYITGLANRGGGTYWGGTSISGGGANVGGGSTRVGGRGYVNWGGTAHSNNTPTGGHGSAGSVKWAEGGITDHPTWGVFGEAGREAFVPISDRAAGLRILPRVMRELGFQQFAKGGFAGTAANAITARGVTVNVYPSQGMNETQLAKKVVKEVSFLMNGGGI